MIAMFRIARLEFVMLSSDARLISGDFLVTGNYSMVRCKNYAYCLRGNVTS